jgi:hypothetical protein
LFMLRTSLAHVRWTNRSRSDAFWRSNCWIMNSDASWKNGLRLVALAFAKFWQFVSNCGELWRFGAMFGSLWAICDNIWAIYGQFLSVFLDYFRQKFCLQSISFFLNFNGFAQKIKSSWHWSREHRNCFWQLWTKFSNLMDLKSQQSIYNFDTLIHFRHW